MAGTALSARKYKAYPEYRDTELRFLEKIPKAWSTSKVRFISSFGRGLTITKANLKDTGVPCVSYGEVHSKYGFEIDPLKHQLKCVDKEYLESSPYAILSKGDFIFADTSEDIEGSGNFTQLISDEVLFAGYHTVVIRPNITNYYRFLAYLFDSTEFRTQVRDAVKGVKVFSVTQAILKNISIWLPEYNEQQKIASFLDHETAKIDTLIAKQEKLIELLKEKRQAVISHAVTKGLNPNAPMRDSGVEWLGEVPEHWEVKKIKYIVKEPLLYGANEAAEDIDKSQPRFVRITDVDEDGTLRDDTFRSLPQEIALPYMLKDGDILLARSGGTVGKSFIYRNSWGSCCFAGYLIKASINEGIIDADWVYFNTLTNFYWDWIKSSQIQATIQNVSADKYNNFEIAIPSKDESREIIDFLFKSLKRFDDLTLKSESAIKLMQERKTALISAAVTGKIDVRDFVSEQGQPQGI
ncbi:restriction endonuclease subunit S [Pseudoalteromonas sp. Z9A6]|uniref:restriction endonuclease subunit S n=1 Tax=Pseudoalteromonas sp. Z9A6 TaxID=2686352 RepID=UPI0013FD604F|nr:restriction endonuclease subunit S [Pseudoalteromonas sp. Z9A6]